MTKPEKRTDDEMTVEQLDITSGGRIRWIDIHMLYKDFIKMPVTGPQPTRYA